MSQSFPFAAELTAQSALPSILHDIFVQDGSFLLVQAQSSSFDPSVRGVHLPDLVQSAGVVFVPESVAHPWVLKRPETSNAAPAVKLEFLTKARLFIMCIDLVFKLNETK